MFSTKLKIGVQPMYPVGTIDWLLELHCNGIVPGIFYSDLTHENHYISETDWNKFFSISNNIIITMNARHFRSPEFMKWFMKYKPKYIELQNGARAEKKDYIGQHKKDIAIIKMLKKHSSVYVKDFLFHKNDFPEHIHKEMTAINVKNNRAAGSCTEHTLSESINYAKQNFNLPIVVSGGISNKEQYDEAFRLGADCVLVGTIFAVCKESNLSEQAKKLILENTSKDIEKLGPDKRNGITLGETIIDDDDNLTKNLTSLTKDGKNGVVYVGKGIDNIHKIRPIQEIIKIFN